MSTKDLSIQLDHDGNYIFVSTKVAKTAAQEKDAAFNRKHDETVRQTSVSSRSVLVVGDVRVHHFEGCFDPWNRNNEENREILRVKTIYRQLATVKDLPAMLHAIDLDHYGVVLLDLLHHEFVYESIERTFRAKPLSTAKIGDLSNIWRRVLFGLNFRHPETQFVLMIPPNSDFCVANFDLFTGIKDSQAYAHNLDVFRTVWYLGSPDLRIYDLNMCFGIDEFERLATCYGRRNSSYNGNKIYPFTAYVEEGFIYNEIARNKILKKLPSQLLSKLIIEEEFDNNLVPIKESLLEINFMPRLIEKVATEYQWSKKDCHLHYSGPEEGSGSVYDISQKRDSNLLRKNLYILEIPNNSLRTSQKRKCELELSVNEGTFKQLKTFSTSQKNLLIHCKEVENRRKIPPIDSEDASSLDSSSDSESDSTYCTDESTSTCSTSTASSSSSSTNSNSKET